MTCASKWLLLFLATAVHAAEYDGLRARIRRHLVETGTPSIAVALARDGRIVWEEGFGWADKERRIAATEHTMYSLASISKPITATGLMTLVERKQIDLDKPIDDYLGRAKLNARVGDAREATVRRVANHSSGLPLHYQFFYADEPYRRPSMDETILRYANLVTKPGERYQYSNLGFGLLDYAISRVSGTPYRDFMRREVFVPLGLTHTSVEEGPSDLHAMRYAGDGSAIPFYGFDHPGGSAIYSSAHDLVRFGLFHLKVHLAGQKAILLDASIDEMRRATRVIDAASGYGIGWNIRGDVVSHNGSMGGVATTLRLIPSEKLALVVLCNAGVQLPHAIADEILAAVLPNRKPLPPGADGKPVAFRPAKEMQGTWVGTLATYQGDIPLTMEVKAAGDVHIKLGAQLETVVGDPAFRDGMFTGRFASDIGAEDANRRPYDLLLSLTLRGDTWNGSVSALSRPSVRAGNALSSWVELKRVPEAGATFRIKPRRPVAELRAEALKASPPLERNKLPASLSGLTRLDSTIKLDIRYAGTENFLGTPVYESARAFMQKPAAEALVRAHRALAQSGYGLLIHDAYRPWYVTKIFWDATSDEERAFVADPSKGSLHNRGCAVDLTLYDLSTGKPVEMPSVYDEMTPRAFPDYPGGTAIARWHRDLLRRAMEKEGFKVYVNEWWHFDYKDAPLYGIGNLPFEQLTAR